MTNQPLTTLVSKMTYNIYRTVAFDPDNFAQTFKNSVLLWVEQVTVLRQEDLIEHLLIGHNDLKHIIGQDVITKSGKNTELLVFPNGTKLAPITQSMVYPISWYSLLVS